MKGIVQLIFLLFATTVFAQEPEDLAQAQLEAYNNRDIEAFLTPYSDSVKVFTFPAILQYQGKDKMRSRYASFFAAYEDLHCRPINRIVMGYTVIDQEEVTIQSDLENVHAIAIYKIWDAKIQEVYFIRKE